MPRLGRSGRRQVAQACGAGGPDAILGAAGPSAVPRFECSERDAGGIGGEHGQPQAVGIVQRNWASQCGCSFRAVRGMARRPAPEGVAEKFGGPRAPCRISPPCSTATVHVACHPIVKIDRSDSIARREGPVQSRRRRAGPSSRQDRAGPAGPAGQPELWSVAELVQLNESPSVSRRGRRCRRLPASAWWWWGKDPVATRGPGAWRGGAARYGILRANCHALPTDRPARDALVQSPCGF